MVEPAVFLIKTAAWRPVRGAGFNARVPCTSDIMSSASTVTVVIPARNAAGTIVETLTSVLGQPHLDEVVVVDDRSRDDTAQRVRALGDPRIRIIEGPATGISDALNAGFAAATGAYVVRCDADDLLAPGRLARQRAWLDAHPGFVGTSAGFSTIDERGYVLANLACEGVARDVTPDLRAGRVLTHLGSWMIRRDALRAAGGARPWFETAEDVDLQYRLACLGQVWLEPVPAYLYRLHGGSVTHSRKAARLDFFDRMARDFLAQRIATGTDALDRGEAPAIPDFDAAAPGHLDLRDQISGHLVSEAWRDFARGNRRAGLARMTRALRRNPGALGYWRGLSVMLMKCCLRPRRA